MTTETILEMLQRVRDGGLRPEEAMERLANLPYEEAGFAKIDHHRRLRTGPARGYLRRRQDAGAGGGNLLSHGGHGRRCARDPRR